MRLTRPLLLALALTCIAPVGPGACQREVDQASERVPVLATVRIAPIADDHPWVMALITQTSITRPHGVDARLEGLSGAPGPGGARRPDPILEAETRADLVSWLETYEAQHPRPPQLVPIWELDPFGPEHRIHARLYFLAHERGFTLDEHARARLERHPQGPAVHLELGPEQTQALQALSSAFIGRRLGVALDDEALMLPIVIEPIPDGHIELRTQTSLPAAQTAPALLQRLITK